ncbi:MAG: hypothetical protein HQL32_14595, partial [Planctomycetes bacterium]|nr:hypothetical protein [Planctomycetota bacterium]
MDSSSDPQTPQISTGIKGKVMKIIIRSRYTFLCLFISILSLPALKAENLKTSEADWFPWRVPYSSSVVDLSHLVEAPAGKHGFLKTKERNFVFSDGTPIKFWGTNVVGIACMPEKKNAVILAKTMRKRGFNLVRFHFYEAKWTGDKGATTLIDYTKGDSQHWREDKLDLMFYFINELKKNGVYTMIDANSGREYLKGDGLPTRLPPRARGHAIFVERCIELQEDMISRLFSRKNPYTGLAMKNDPAIAILNLNNENDCLYGGVPWNLEPYTQQMKKRYKKWAEARGEKTVPSNLNKVSFWPNRRSKHCTKFLMNIQQTYQERMAHFCRETVGINALLCGTNWNMGFFTPLTHQSMDFSDCHLYETHPAKKKKIRGLYPIPNKLALGEHELEFHSKNLFKVVDKPFFSSEWDHRMPVEYRAEYPCFLAYQAAFGNWAGLVHFSAMTTNRVLDFAEGNSNSWYDPAIYGLFPHAILLYQRDALPAQKTVVMKVDPKKIDVMQQTFPAQIKSSEVHNFLVSTEEQPQ